MWIGDFVRCHSVVETAARTLSRAPGRHAGDHALRAARRLHARRAPRHRRRPAPQAACLQRASHARRAVEGRRLRCRPDHAEDLEIGAGAVSGRHSASAPGLVGEARFIILNDLRFGATQAAAHGRRMRGAGPAARRQTAGGMARAGTQSAAPPRSPPGAASTAWRRTTALPSRLPRCGRAGQALAGSRLCRAQPAASCRWVCRLGGGRPGRESLGAQRSSATRRARDLTGTDLREAILALAAASAAVSNDSGLLHVAAAARHAHHRNIRADQPLALGAAQSAGGNDPGAEPNCPAGLATSRSAGLGHHRCMVEIGPDEVYSATRRALAAVAVWPNERGKPDITRYSSNPCRAGEELAKPGSSDMTILVTGGAGYIGSHMVYALPTPASAWSCSTISPPASIGRSRRACR